MSIRPTTSNDAPPGGKTGSRNCRVNSLSQDGKFSQAEECDHFHRAHVSDGEVVDPPVYPYESVKLTFVSRVT
jgi:hypothetical protein